MRKVKKIREIEKKIKIKEIDTDSKPHQHESSLIKEINEAEEKSATITSSSEFKVPAVVLEPEVSEPTPETTQIRRETRERNELERQNIVRGAYSTRAEETTTYSTGYYSPQSQQQGMIQRGRQISPEEFRVPMTKQGIQPVAERSEEREERYTTQKRRRYPWEV